MSIPKRASRLPKDNAIYLTKMEQSFLGITDSLDSPHVNLKYYDPEFECFSEWTYDELKAFSEFTQKLKRLTWQQIYRSGGKPGDKTGLGYTPHKTRTYLPKHPELDSISLDITFFELRMTQKARVHGFRVKSAFFLVWLDRNHQIYPQ
ncbi:MAG6450 family protein [Candidatus Parabeggiatoa sp. HSG14]|uniref:MAG6450 family protein n=1 Tax=Candidatus Parabeggiatoa sp. HSG14 TaxID=3055593 RepID=UPI0025A742D4|nr:hypothetical protein [Thiotrichales bacterium HSG14]